VDAGLVDKRDVLVRKQTPFADSSPRAQRLNVGNTCPPISTFSRAIPSNGPTAVLPPHTFCHVHAGRIPRQIASSANAPQVSAAARTLLNDPELRSSLTRCQSPINEPRAALRVHGKTISTYQITLLSYVYTAKRCRGITYVDTKIRMRCLVRR
jgi:hypothetical protein